MIFDSCRYDVFAEANIGSLASLGKLYKAYTNTNHTTTAFLDFVGYGDFPKPGNEVEKIEIAEQFNPRIRVSKVKGLKEEGVPTFILTDSPHFNQKNKIVQAIAEEAELFCNFEMDSFIHAEDILDIAKGIPLSDDYFVVLWFGETHFPYNSGGVMIPNFSELRHQMVEYSCGRLELPEGEIAALKQRQVEAVEYLAEKVWEFLKDHLDANIIVTSDHGESFGENHKLWHGNDIHPCQFTVPLLFHSGDEDISIQHEDVMIERLKELGYFQE